MCGAVRTPRVTGAAAMVRFCPGWGGGWGGLSPLAVSAGPHPLLSSLRSPGLTPAPRASAPPAAPPARPWLPARRAPPSGRGRCPRGQPFPFPVLFIWGDDDDGAKGLGCALPQGVRAGLLRVEFVGVRRSWLSPQAVLPPAIVPSACLAAQADAGVSWGASC